MDAVDGSSALDLVRSYLSNGKFHHIITGNTLMLLEAEKDPVLQRILEQAALVIPESSGILWASRRLGHALSKITPGIDFMLTLCGWAAEMRLPIYLLGSAPGIAESASQKLQRQFGGLSVVGVGDGYFKGHEADVIQRVQRAKPAILFVGMGMPAQEKWIAQHLDSLQVPVVMGVGGSFDVISGRLDRAPRLMRQAGIEWLYRWVQEPWRWRRISQLPVFAWKVWRQEKLKESRCNVTH